MPIDSIVNAHLAWFRESPISARVLDTIQNMQTTASGENHKTFLIAESGLRVPEAMVADAIAKANAGKTVVFVARMISLQMVRLGDDRTIPILDLPKLLGDKLTLISQESIGKGRKLPKADCYFANLSGMSERCYGEFTRCVEENPAAMYLLRTAIFNERMNAFRLENRFDLQVVRVDSASLSAEAPRLVQRTIPAQLDPDASLGERESFSL